MKLHKRTALGSTLALGLLVGWGPGLGAQIPAYSSNDARPTPLLTVGERADIFLARRDYAAAIRLLQDAIKHHQADASIYNRLAIADQQTNNLGQAEKNYKNAIKRDRHSATYVNNLGTVYYMRRKYKAAAKQFSKALRLDNTKATYYVNLGGAEFSQKHFQPALAAYRHAIEIDPNSLFPATGNGTLVADPAGSDTPRFHYDLSRLFCSMGMLDDALHQFRQAYEQHYRDIKKSLTDPQFAPLRMRPEYRVLMGLPPVPLPPAVVHADPQGGR
ncbi:MAG TPA: tetratricopeptide repeat protein [Terriglobales bacterium]|nr:tetratricopeptide repeat protein [Terriglobales bacterium]